MKRPRNLLWLLPLAATLLTAGGCLDRVEIGQLGIVSALGIDLGPEPGLFEVTLQLIRPSEIGTSNGSGNGRPFIIISTTGSSVFAAIRQVTAISSRKAFLAHARVVVIGQELAGSGIGGALDLLYRDEDIRPNTWLLVATGKAKEIISSVTEFENIPGIGLAELLAASKTTSHIAQSTLHQFGHSLISGPGLQSVASLVDAVTAATIDDERSFVGSKVSPAPSIPGSEEKILRLVGSAIFRDDRLVGTLNATESRGYRWVKGQVSSGIISIRLPKSDDLVELEVVHSSSRIKVMVEKAAAAAKPRVRVLLRASARIGSQAGSENLTELEQIQEVEALYAAAVQHEVAQAIEQAQLRQTDIFGFGDRIRANYPAAWRELQTDWPRTFSSLPIEVEVKVHVDRHGLIGTANRPRQ